MWWYSTGVIVLLLFGVEALSEGEPCIKNGVSAICRNLRNCSSAINDVRNRRHPQICSFNGDAPVVCCTDGGQPTTLLSPVSSTPPLSGGPFVTQDYPDDYEISTQCDPINPILTAPKTGQKAWDKCIEYQEQLVYPCGEERNLTGKPARLNHCLQISQPLVTDYGPYMGEYTHMVLLGFGATAEKVEWMCSGTLISDRYILTAGHCTHSRDSGVVTYATIGALERPRNVDNSKLYKIKRIVRHPQFKPPSRYHNIALLETETQMTLDKLAVPACLHVGDFEADRATVTGWDQAADDKLRKATLFKFSIEECAKYVQVSRHLRNGLDADTQICYGDRNDHRNTCQSNGGGPLQVMNNRIQCMYTVVGVMSFGGSCRLEGQPGVYTRVKAYVPWIESVVWPETT